MAETRYSKDHEYIRIEGDVGTVGISDYAQSQLGDVVFVELPAVGKALAKGGEAAVDPAGKGWFLKLKIKDAGELDGLMNEAEYQDYVKTL